VEIAGECGVPVIERNISVSEFYNADEVFICGTVGEIAPVSEIDGKKIGTEIPGPLTRQFAEKYAERTREYGVPVDE
jgi:branched-chain amino acid aminotransferase